MHAYKSATFIKRASPLQLCNHKFALEPYDDINPLLFPLLLKVFGIRREYYNGLDVD